MFILLMFSYIMAPGSIVADIIAPKNQSEVAKSHTSRFIDNANGTITDQKTGIIWLKEANCFGTKPLNEAVLVTGFLSSGACGLADSSTAGDWRIPETRELESLIDPERIPALPAGHPFSNVQSNYYWASDSVSLIADNPWDAFLIFGCVGDSDKPDEVYIWPVRSKKL